MLTSLIGIFYLFKSMESMDNYFSLLTRIQHFMENKHSVFVVGFMYLIIGISEYVYNNHICIFAFSKVTSVA